MKRENIIIGMKVRPFQKTVKGWEGLNNSEHWCLAKNNGQLYLFVNSYDKEENVYILSDTKNNYKDGDYFNAEDFEPYQEKENGFEIKCLDCNHIGCDLNVVYCGFQFSCPNCGQIYKQ